MLFFARARPRYEEHCPLSISVLNSPERRLPESVLHFGIQVVGLKNLKIRIFSRAKLFFLFQSVSRRYRLLRNKLTVSSSSKHAKGLFT